MKKLLAIVCLFVLYVGVTAARADELVDMAQKMYPNEKINPINRPKSSLIVDANTEISFGKTILMKFVILPV